MSLAQKCHFAQMTTDEKIQDFRLGRISLWLKLEISIRNICDYLWYMQMLFCRRVAMCSTCVPEVPQPILINKLEVSSHLPLIWDNVRYAVSGSISSNSYIISFYFHIASARTCYCKHHGICARRIICVSGIL